MSNNLYRAIAGSILLTTLYLELELVMYITFSIILFEGITNLRIPKVVNKIRNIPEPTYDNQPPSRFSFEAEQAFRLALSLSVLTTYSLGTDSVLWFFPWFMGFAILGAGVSGLCPMIALIKWLGFR